MPLLHIPDRSDALYDALTEYQVSLIAEGLLALLSLGRAGITTTNPDEVSDLHLLIGRLRQIHARNEQTETDYIPE